MAKIWKLKTQIPENISLKLSAYPSLVQHLLYNRGLIEQEQIEEFLEPKYEGLNDPFLFKDMQKAVERIWKAVGGKEKICIYGDYDADAVTANAVLRQTFRYLNHQEISSYIPDRFTEGYGVNLEALKKIADDGAKVIITVDCGTNSTDAAEFCKQNNIDFIITDHHELIGEKPDALALINPKNRTDGYPYEDITGVGVAFKLASALLKDARTKAQVPNHVDGFEKWLLDLVAIGTVADCHSLLGENRILVKYGLRVLQKTRWQGLRALIKSSGLDFTQKAPDTYTLGFVIAPRLNAAGRLEHANIALDLLMEDNPALAEEKALGLEEINRRRQQLTQSVLSEAKEKVMVIQERKILALVGEGWPKGIMGLVAGKLAEEYYKPVIVLEQTDVMLTGSARTAGDFDIIEALKYGAEHLLRFGGHKQAAGLSMDAVNFPNFYSKILEYAEINIKEITLPALNLEAELAEGDLALETCELLNAMEPFGIGNPRPKFLIKEMAIQSARNVGATGQHTQYQLQKGDRTISGIAFNSAILDKNFKVGDTIDVAAELMEDGWNGRRQVKLKIVDLRHPNILSS